MDNTPQIADIYRCDWVGNVSSGIKYFMVIGDRRADGWEVWNYNRNRAERRFLRSYSDEFCTVTYTKVA